MWGVCFAAKQALPKAPPPSHRYAALAACLQCVFAAAKSAISPQLISLALHFSVTSFQQWHTAPATSAEPLKEVDARHYREGHLGNKTPRLGLLLFHPFSNFGGAREPSARMRTKRTKLKKRTREGARAGSTTRTAPAAAPAQSFSS